MAIAKSWQKGGVAGGEGSLASGLVMFLGIDLIPKGLFIVFAVLVSLWMVAIGLLPWRRADETWAT